MKPGRELDALIAERVMGWTLLENSSVEMCGSFACWRAPHGSKYPAVPSYSTDIAAAWEVVERLHQVVPEFWFSLSREPKGSGWYVENGPDRQAMSEGSTAPHAICLAALKVVGVELP